MSEPIFRRLVDDVEEGVRRITHPHGYDAANEPAAADETENPMGLADTIKQDLTEGVEYVEGWVGRMKAAAPEIVAKLDKFANGPIGQALEEAGEAIDPPAEAVVAGWIRDLASLKLATPAPAAPEPAPADPAAAAA